MFLDTSFAGRELANHLLKKELEKTPMNHPDFSKMVGDYQNKTREQIEIKKQIGGPDSPFNR